MEVDNISIGCTISSNNPAAPLGISILLDDQVLYENNHVTETVKFTSTIPDAGGQHVLKFVLSGKTPSMTELDHTGNIIKDALLSISDITIDDINIDILVQDLGVYTHNFNSTSNPTSQKFYGSMGCNGTFSVDFSSPVYLWLLEHM